jgi:Sortilin, neurotensin receptor 3,
MCPKIIIFFILTIFSISVSNATKITCIKVTPRITNIVISPKNSKLIYASSDGGISGSSGDGIFKSINAGHSWFKINKGLGTKSITNLVINSLHPNELYASGDSKDGIYKTDNGGNTWHTVNKGLESTNSIPEVFTIEINPKTPNILLASLEGNEPGTGRLFFTENGAKHWRSVYEGDAIYELAFNPKHPENVFGTTFNALVKSYDGEKSWREAIPWKIKGAHGN